MNIEIRAQIQSLLNQIATQTQNIKEMQRSLGTNINITNTLLKKCTLWDIVKVMPFRVRPTLTPIEKPGMPIVMMIPGEAEDSGIVLWEHKWDPGSINARLAYGNGDIRDGSFYMPCGCCCLDNDGRIDIVKRFRALDKAEQKEQWPAFKAEVLRPMYVSLVQSVVAVAKSRGLRRVFVQRPEEWQRVCQTPDLVMLEGASIGDAFVKLYGREVARSFFEFWRSDDYY